MLSRASTRILPRAGTAARAFSSTPKNDIKVLAVLYKGGQAAKEEPRLLGTIENQLGLRDWLESQGHEYVVTDSKDGPGNVFEKEIAMCADVLITTPFHPGYATREILQKAKNLKIAITAGVGSDHIDLNAANEHKVIVAEVSGSNVVSVAEHVILTILELVRNFVPAHEQIVNGNWNVAHIARGAFDLENKVVATIGAGRIGYRVLERLVPFDCKELLYFDYAPLPREAEAKVGARKVDDLDDLLSQADVITVNAPLHEKTRNLINKDNIGKVKKGAWIINTARGAIVNADAVKEAVASGQVSGYGGDVWNVQPAPKDHPWRTLQNPIGGGSAMTPHYSGTTLDAQARYAAGTREILEQYLTGKAIRPENLIVKDGVYATRAYGQREQTA